MNIIDYYAASPETQEKLLNDMKKCDWDAGGWLCSLICESKVEKTFGEGSRVLMLTDGDKLASFCTLAPTDEIDDPSLTPWSGFVFTFPEYRGRRCAGMLLEKAKELARKDGAQHLYVSSEEVGLYEKYGFEFVENRMSVHGYMTGIFRCKL